MFTIKFYREGAFRERIFEAESFTVLRGASGVTEITLHSAKVNGEWVDFRLDVGDAEEDVSPERFDKAIIENAMGKTTEIIYAHKAFREAA